MVIAQAKQSYLSVIEVYLAMKPRFALLTRILG